MTSFALVIFAKLTSHLLNRSHHTSVRASTLTQKHQICVLGKKNTRISCLSIFYTFSAVSPTQPHAIVKYSFNGSQSDELSCAAGDVVVLKRDVDDQWVYGTWILTGRVFSQTFPFFRDEQSYWCQWNHSIVFPGYSSPAEFWIFGCRSDSYGDLRLPIKHSRRFVGAFVPLLSHYLYLAC